MRGAHFEDGYTQPMHDVIWMPVSKPRCYINGLKVQLGNVMIRRSIFAVLLYLAGLVALVVWSVHGFVTGAPKNDWALMIVLPIAWAFSYWPMLGSLLMIARIRGLQRTLEGIATELNTGVDPSPEKLRELEEVGTELAARENRIPEFIVRPIIRKALARLVRDGTLKRIADKGRKTPVE
jgi:hypothetical protein